MIYKHKKTNQKLLLKKRGSLVSTYFKLDEKNNKIPNYLSKKNKHPLKDVNGNLCYEVAICSNDNVKVCHTGL